MLQVVVRTGIITYYLQQLKGFIMPKDMYVNFPRSMRVDEGLHESLKRISELEHRSLTNLIGLILIEYTERYKQEHKLENI